MQGGSIEVPKEFANFVTHIAPWAQDRDILYSHGTELSTPNVQVVQTQSMGNAVNRINQ